MKWFCGVLIVVSVVLLAASIHGRMWLNAAAFGVNAITLGMNFRTLRKG